MADTLLEIGATTLLIIGGDDWTAEQIGRCFADASFTVYIAETLRDIDIGIIKYMPDIVLLHYTESLKQKNITLQRIFRALLADEVGLAPALIVIDETGHNAGFCAKTGVFYVRTPTSFEALVAIAETLIATH